MEANRDSTYALDTERLVRRYLQAKGVVINAGFAAEIHWQAKASPARLTASTFLREATWVILSAGMRESVVKNLFADISIALHDFDTTAVVSDPCVRDAILRTFSHERKVDAILAFADVASDLGDDGIRARLSRGAEEFLRGLPYMGRATTRHLIKNLGWSVSKPDRHLIRLAVRAGRSDPDALCTEIASWLGDPVSVVDVVLWRWSTIHERWCQRRECDGLPHSMQNLSDQHV